METFQLFVLERFIVSETRYPVRIYLFLKLSNLFHRVKPEATIYKGMVNTTMTIESIELTNMTSEQTFEIARMTQPKPRLQT